MGDSNQFFKPTPASAYRQHSDRGPASDHGSGQPARPCGRLFLSERALERSVLLDELKADRDLAWQVAHFRAARRKLDLLQQADHELLRDACTVVFTAARAAIDKHTSVANEDGQAHDEQIATLRTLACEFRIARKDLVSEAPELDAASDLKPEERDFFLLLGTWMDIMEDDGDYSAMSDCLKALAWSGEPLFAKPAKAMLALEEEHKQAVYRQLNSSDPKKAERLQFELAEPGRKDEE